MDDIFASIVLESKIPCAPTFSQASQEDMDAARKTTATRHHVDAKICYLKQLIQTTTEERDRAREECKNLRRELVLLIFQSSRMQVGAAETPASTLQASILASASPHGYANCDASHDIAGHSLDMFFANDMEWKPAICPQDSDVLPLYSEVDNKECAINMEDYLELNNFTTLEDDIGKKLPELVEDLQLHVGFISDADHKRHGSTCKAPSAMSAYPHWQGTMSATPQPPTKSPHRSSISPYPKLSNMPEALTNQGCPLSSSTSTSMTSSSLSPLLQSQSRLPTNGMHTTKDKKAVSARTSSVPAMSNRLKRSATPSRRSWLPIKPRILSSTSRVLSLTREWSMSPPGMQTPVNSEPPVSVPMGMLNLLPEKGKFLEAIMRAGPLLQSLLLVGPLPQWQCPPPTMDIPKMYMLPSDMEPSVGDPQLLAA